MMLGTNEAVIFEVQIESRLRFYAAQRYAFDDVF